MEALVWIVVGAVSAAAFALAIAVVIATAVYAAKEQRAMAAKATPRKSSFWDMPNCPECGEKAFHRNALMGRPVVNTCRNSHKWES